jgi:ribosomal protein L37AE/L43A
VRHPFFSQETIVGGENTMGDITDKLAYAYIKNIKRWMFCPACGDKMRVNRKSSQWECQKCNYSLSVREFENDYVFWFCDNCNSFLNNQPNFDTDKKMAVCAKCGHNNDITKDSISSICKDCGKIIDSNAKYGLCDDCRITRHEKWIARLKTGAKIVGILSAIAGTIYLVAKSSNDEDSEKSYKYIPNDDTDGGMPELNAEKSWEEENTYIGETPPCPRCGTPLTKKYVFSGMYCDSCRYGLDDDESDDDDESEALSVYDAADIWASHGKDEDYTFGYTEEELENAFRGR